MRAACALGLDGWVRNRSDGSVELVAAGPAKAVDRLIEACRRGPSAAQVEAIDVAEASEEVGDGFEERPTV